jgi:hypothetical protein
MAYITIRCIINPELGPALTKAERDIPLSELMTKFATTLLPPLALILAVRARDAVARIGLVSLQEALVSTWLIWWRYSVMVSSRSMTRCLSRSISSSRIAASALSSSTKSALEADVLRDSSAMRRLTSSRAVIFGSPTVHFVLIRAGVDRLGAVLQVRNVAWRHDNLPHELGV